MADPNTRQGKRTPVTLKIKFKSETLEQFIERYAVDVSQGGIFIRTKEPLAVGTQMKFEFQLRDASPLISGEGTVVWTRENDPSRPSIAPGMGVRFDRLNDGSQTVLERILAEKAKQAPSRGGGGEAIKPLFTDTPTKVAPVPVQEALGVRRSRADSEQTPLPKPMPFHSDADDFDERAFEEATKVRALDDLAAQSALEDGEGGDETKTDAVPPADELAARRGSPRPDSTIDPPVEDSAPNLPEAPEGGKSGRIPRMLDTTPSPRSAPVEEIPAKTRLGVEPAKATTGRISKPVEMRDEPPLVKVPKRSSAPIVIGILVLLAAGIGAVWWFVLREQVADNVATPRPEPGSAQPGSAEPGSNVGSQAVATPGSGSAQAPNVPEAPKGPTVDTVIASSVAKGSIVEVVGTDQKGPAPFTAKLEKDKPYKVRVEAPGFAPLELDVKGGQDKVTAKLVVKPHVITVSSDPAGADILVDGAPTKKVTPADVELTPAQAAKAKIRVSVRHGGFRPVDQVVDASAFADGADKMSAKVDVKLQKMAAPTGGNTGGGQKPAGGGSGSATGSGSAATPPHEPAGAGSGSAAPANGGGGGSGSASPSGAGGGSGTDEPRPE